MQFIHDTIIPYLPFSKRMLLCLSVILFLLPWINAQYNNEAKFTSEKVAQHREHISINDSWRFKNAEQGTVITLSGNSFIYALPPFSVATFVEQ